jgi:hypothetical protein
MDRFELLYGPDTLGAPRDDLDLLKAARDLAAHGEGSQEVTQDMHRVLVTLATVVEVVLPRLDVSPVEFWGSYSSLIARAMEKQRDRIVDRVRTLISAARQRFDAKYDGIAPDGLEALMTESWWDQPFQNDEWARVCPACGAQGISRLRAEVRRRAVHPDLQKRTVPGYKAINFRCHVCKLALESEELVDAAEDFEAWEEVGDLEFWAEDIDSETLTPEDRRDLGFE